MTSDSSDTLDAMWARGRAVETASDAGRRILCVGQHDDPELRRRALAAGAERVLPYRRLFEDGTAILASWLAPKAEIPVR